MKITILIVLLMTVLFIITCDRSDIYGQPIKDDLQFQNIASVLSNPDRYVGSEVGLKGKIVLECGSGCWFQLDDGTGQIHVELTPGNFAIPQKVGKSVTVMGKVMEEDGRLVVHASGVSF